MKLVLALFFSNIIFHFNTTGQEGLIAGAPGEEEEEEEDREVEDEELGEALQDEVDAQAKTSGK